LLIAMGAIPDRTRRGGATGQGLIVLPASRRSDPRSACGRLCADASRHDYVDTTLGLRIGVYRSLVLSVGVFKALNHEGVRRADWSPVGEVEATF